MKKCLSALDILRSLTRQCLNADSMSTNIEKELELMLDSDEGASLQTLRSFLGSIIDTSSMHVIIIDGMDEMNAREQVLLCRTLSKVLRSSSTARVKLLLSGRDTMPSFLQDDSFPCDELKITDLDSRKDIARFVECALADMIENRELQLGDPDLQVEISHTLIEGAQGM